jgi:hypothetical protein
MHRGDRCDLSLFQLGLRLLDYLLNADYAIPVAFCISIETEKVSGNESSGMAVLIPHVPTVASQRAERADARSAVSMGQHKKWA